MNVGGAAVRRLSVGVSLALPLALAACGTTTPFSHTVTAQSGLGSGPNESGIGPGGSGDQALGASGTSGGSTGLGSTSGPGQAGSSATGGETPGSTSSTTGTTGIAIQARGVTASTIAIGIATATAGSDQAVNATYGFTGGSSLNEADVWNAVIADVNKSGGVLGRKLVAYDHQYDANLFAVNPSQLYAATCADFRDDHKVFAVLNNLPPDLSLRTCFAEMGSPWVMADAALASLAPAAAYGEHGGSFLYGPGSITNERLAQLFIPSLLDRRFTEPWNTAAGGPGGVAPVRLGLVYEDLPEFKALYGDYRKELAKHGLTFYDTFVYAADPGTAPAAQQNAVLKFYSEGITHVFGASSLFMRNAQNQGYYPRYAFLPGFGEFGAEQAPGAMKGALTVGWTPAMDVPADKDPGDTPGAKHCRAVMKAVGLDTSNRDNLAVMYPICDAVYAFRAALQAGGVASVAGLHRGFEALRSGFPTAATFAAYLGPNHHYGVDSVRDMAYDTSCSCLIYTSKTNRS